MEYFFCFLNEQQRPAPPIQNVITMASVAMITSVNVIKDGKVKVTAQVIIDFHKSNLIF